MSRTGHRRWRTIRAQVLREEPLCQLRYPGICTYVSTTVDHVIPFSVRPDLNLVRGNLRGACRPCNLHRGARPYVRESPTPALDFFD